MRGVQGGSLNQNNKAGTTLYGRYNNQVEESGAVSEGGEFDKRQQLMKNAFM
jgi:hypothetical protein